MNISKAQIAALVLGYLKGEKMTSVVEEFTKSCCYFTENNQNIKNGKYFVTRVAGMTLVDILEQFSVIYGIVQSRLEETTFKMYSRTTLVEQLLHLLDKEPQEVTSSSTTSEVDATPAHTLPGNVDLENTTPKTPKKRNNRSRDKEEVIDMAEALTQSLLGNHELHEKIAATINSVRNTPDVAKTAVEEISVGASKEIDAVIKNVIQRTEEDPVYNKLIDEIIGAAPFENPSPKKQPLCTSTPTSSHLPKPAEDPPRLRTDPLEGPNNEAIRSIIEASQSFDDPPVKADPAPGEVYLYEGTLDSYLKSSGAINPPSQNPVFINPGGLIVMPPPEVNKQFYIVNNQPVLKMNVSTVLTENEFMSMPTIIVNDEAGVKSKRPKTIKPKVAETKAEAGNSQKASGSYIRNLDFSTPSSSSKDLPTPSCSDKAKNEVPWDGNLRQLITGCTDKSPPKRKNLKTLKKKKKKAEEENVPEECEKPGHVTPVKDMLPKTPGGALDHFHCTPFNDVIDEQLKGVDLTSIPTPSLPITPGFALTPGDMLGTHHRPTDYSGSSSYYQPSEPEPPKSQEDLLEELRGFENRSPTPKLKIISDQLIIPAPAHYSEHVNNFNSKVIGKKNLSLIRDSSSSSSSSSDSEDDRNSTVVSTSAANVIKDIITNVEVKNTLGEEEKKKSLLTSLEMKRLRVIGKLKTEAGKKRKPLVKKVQTKTQKKKDGIEEENVRKLADLYQRGIHLIPNKSPQKNEAPPEKKETPSKKSEAPLKKSRASCKKNEGSSKNIPKKDKAPSKKNKDESPIEKDEGQLEKNIEESIGPDLAKADTVAKLVEEEEVVIFDRKNFEDYDEIVMHGDRTRKRSLKSYDLGLLKKTMTAKVFIGDEEVTRIMKWSECESLYDSRDYELELMDYAVAGGSPTKGGKKRKSKLDENPKQKKNKSIVQKLLKEVDIDNFLDKVHGE